MKLLGVGSLSAVYPHTFVESDRVDNERIAFPPTDGVPVVSERQVFGMLFQIHIDNAESVWPSDIHDVDALQFTHLHDVDSIGSCELSGTTRGFAPGVRFH